MGYGELPEDPDKRRVIVVVDDHARERLDYEPAGSDLLDDRESHVVVVGDHQSSPLCSHLKKQGQLLADTVLLQSPYHPDEYAPIENAHLDFALSKHHLFIELCGLLGAKRVKIKEVRVSTTERSKNVKVSGSRLKVTPELVAEFSGLDRLAQELSIEATFEGGKSDQEQTDHFLAANRLASDHHLASLARIASHQGNPIKKHIVKQSLTERTKSNMEVAAKLKVPTFGFTGKIAKATDQTVQFDVTAEVTF